jgi:hypothetical protein
LGPALELLKKFADFNERTTQQRPKIITSNDSADFVDSKNQNNKTTQVDRHLKDVPFTSDISIVK